MASRSRKHIPIRCPKASHSCSATPVRHCSACSAQLAPATPANEATTDVSGHRFSYRGDVRATTGFNKCRAAYDCIVRNNAAWRKIYQGTLENIRLVPYVPSHTRADVE